METTKVNLNSITKNTFILKPNFHMNFGKRRIEQARKNGLRFESLGNVVDKVFTGGIFKRVFVESSEFGLPYISAQHMMNSNPLDVAKIISKKYTPRQDDMSLKENQILISCAGTVGNVKLITSDLEGVIGSQDIIRVDVDDKLLFGYLYSFLSSQTAYTYMQSFIYGSVVPRIEPNTLKKLPIPILPKEFQQKIGELMGKSEFLHYFHNTIEINYAVFFILFSVVWSMEKNEGNEEENLKLSYPVKGKGFGTEFEIAAFRIVTNESGDRKSVV